MSACSSRGITGSESKSTLDYDDYAPLMIKVPGLRACNAAKSRACRILCVFMTSRVGYTTHVYFSSTIRAYLAIEAVDYHGLNCWSVNRRTMGRAWVLTGVEHST